MTATTTSRSTDKTIGGYVPLKKQAIFHTCPADHVLFGGAAGGSKSFALATEGVTTALARPEEHVLVTRREWDELRELMALTRKLCAINTKNKSDTLPGVYWSAGDRRMYFPNDSIITFAHLLHEDDVESHQGPGYSLWLPDEWTQLSPYQINFMRTRLRSANPDIHVRIRGASNPGNVGHQLLKDMFVDPTNLDVELLAYFDFERAELVDVTEYADCWVPYPPGHRGMPQHFDVWRPDMSVEMEAANRERIADGLAPMEEPTRCFIRSMLKDNPYYYTDPTYQAQLLANPDKALVKAMLEGDWDLFEGMFFNEWNPAIHIVDPIQVPAHWTVWGGLDHGFRAPTAHLWATMNPNTNQVIIFDEVYQSGLTDSQACREIREKRPERLIYSAADPVMWNKGSSDTGLTTADIYERNGVHLTPGINNRELGWNRVRSLLSVDPLTDNPGLVITRNCVNLIREIPAAVYDKHKTEDLDTKGSDHALDALRYLCMARNTRAMANGTPLVVGDVRY